jgi:hypothetical protein
MADVSFMLLHPDTSLGSVLTEQKPHVNTNDHLGFATVFGVFQEYYSTHDVLQGSKNDLATVGTTSTVCKG